MTKSLLCSMLLVLAPPCLSHAAASSGGDDLAVLAQKANNPLSDVWLMITQNDYTFYGGSRVDGERQVNSVKFQPVLPVPILKEKWNLIFRPIFTYNSVPLDDDLGDLVGLDAQGILGDPDLLSAAQTPFGRTTGLGDTVLLTMVGPNKLDGWIWGFGVTQVFPTAHEDVLGQDKWQAGPGGILLRLGKDHGGLGLENWNIGFLWQHWWSYAGDDDRDETAQSDIQYFLNWRYNETQLIGMTPNIRINWKADSFKDAVSFPIGLGTIGMFKLGKMPMRWGIELQYYLLQPHDVAPKINLKFFLAPVVPNPLKG